MSPMGTFVRAGLLFALLAAPAQAQRAGGGGGAGDAFLRGVAEYYQVSVEETFVLSQWRLAQEEIPVVLFLADRGGVSPDVVAAQRRNRTPWFEIATGLGVSAGEFHLDLGSDAGSLAELMVEFGSRPTAQWSQIEITDAELVALVNVRFMSRFLGLPLSDIVGAWKRHGSFVEAYRALEVG